MNTSNKKILLVGDNPFHGISHLSQERAIARGKDLLKHEHAAGLVRTALDNGADGFMFSTSDTTLPILKLACEGRERDSVRLYAIVPYAFEFVRLAVTEGGIPGLTKKMGREIVFSANIGSITEGIKGIIGTDPSSLLRAYLLYEESRIRSAAGKAGKISSLLLHEVVTDMALALDLEWLFRAHVDLMTRRGIKPGFQTHNFACLVDKLEKWKINPGMLVIAAQFNSLGFWMCPTREECESALKRIPQAEVIAYGILASGYLGLPGAVEYMKDVPNLDGIALGVSKQHQAQDSFKLIKEII